MGFHKTCIAVLALLASQACFAAGPPAGKPKWPVTHQLVLGQPWPNAKLAEAKLLQEVKENEATRDQRLVFALNDLGAHYRANARWDDAEKVYRRVLKLQQDRGLANHHDLALTYNDLGVVAFEAGKLDAAEAHFKLSREIWEKRWEMPLQTEDYAVTLHNYAVLLDKRGRGAEGAALEAKADDVMAQRRKAMGL